MKHRRIFLAAAIAAGIAFQASASDTGGLSELASGALVGALLAPIGEELLFRGYAVGRLLDAGWSRARAFIAPGLLFGLLHVPGIEGQRPGRAPDPRAGSDLERRPGAELRRSLGDERRVHPARLLRAALPRWRS